MEVCVWGSVCRDGTGSSLMPIPGARVSAAVESGLSLFHSAAHRQLRLWPVNECMLTVVCSCAAAVTAVQWDWASERGRLSPYLGTKGAR